MLLPTQISQEEQHAASVRHGAAWAFSKSPSPHCPTCAASFLQGNPRVQTKLLFFIPEFLTWWSADRAQSAASMVTALTLLPPCWKPQHKGFGSHWDAAIQTIHLQHVGDLGWLWSHTSLTVPVETLQSEGMKAIASCCGSAQVPGTWGGTPGALFIFGVKRRAKPWTEKASLQGLKSSLPAHRGKLEEGWRDFPIRLHP